MNVCKCKKSVSVRHGVCGECLLPLGSINMMKMISLKIHPSLYNELLEIFKRKKIEGEKAGWHEVLIPALKQYVKKNGKK